MTPIDTEQEYNKIQHSFMIETLKKLRIKKELLQSDKQHLKVTLNWHHTS